MSTKEKLELEVHHLKDFISRIEKDRASEQEDWKKQRDDQSRRSKDMENNYQGQLQRLGQEKQKEKEALERLMKTEL